MIVKHFEDVPAEAVEGEPGLTVRWLVSESDGAPNFAMRYMEVESDATSPFHGHSWEHEVFVMSGKGVVRSERGEDSVGPRDVVYIPPNDVHQFMNVGQEPLVFLCLIPNLSLDGERVLDACGWRPTHA